nr:phage tail protein [Pseudomonas sp. PH1b]
MDYPKSVASVGLVNGKFVDENPVTGQVGSLISSEWGNAVTDELLNVIRAGGKQPAEAEHDQLLAAIQKIVRDSIPPEKIRTTLAEYGITDAYTKSVTYTKAEIEALLKNMSALPVGAMVPFPKGTVPAGFLEVDGSVQSAAAYPDLAAYLGTAFNTGGEGAGSFRLPESRGEFLRGWDHGRGVDAGRVLGSYQNDALQNILGNVGGVRNDSAPTLPSGAFYATADAGGFQGAGGRLSVVNFDASRVVRTATETRPRNLAVMWCIKAWNAAVNQGNIDISGLAVNISALEARPRGLGDGQTWQNVTASRVSGTVYTNTTGRPIQVQVSINSGAVSATCGGVTVTNIAYYTTFVVPAGATYSVTLNNAVSPLWSELRT